MFTKYIKFNLKGACYLSRVIETLSSYRHGIKDESDLKIVSCYDDINANFPIFTVTLHCRRDMLTSCLDDILKLDRNGAFIEKLIVK